MLFREVIAVYCENHMNTHFTFHTFPLCLSFQDKETYLGGVQFESWPGHQLSWGFLGGFPQSQADIRIVPQLGYNCFLPNPLQFVLHPTIACHNSTYCCSKKFQSLCWQVTMPRVWSVYCSACLQWRNSLVLTASSWPTNCRNCQMSWCVT
jgi:hypothetical protein